MAIGQRPDRAVPRPGDVVARASTCSPPATAAGTAEPGGGHQVLRARWVLVGVLPLRHRPRLRRDRLDQPRRRSSTRSPARVPVERNDTLVLAGIALLLVGLGFKVAAVPVPRLDARRLPGRADAGHRRSWRRSARSPRSPPWCGCSSSALPFYRDDWRPAIWVLAVLSLVVGSVLAVVQTDVKRMLAYSSISHAGFILVGVEAAGHRAGEADTGAGIPATLVYLLAYAVLVVGTFAVVALVARRGDRRDRPRLVPRASASSTRRWRSRSPCSSSPRPACRSRAASSPSSASSAPPSTSTATRIAIIAMVASVIGAFLYLRIIVATWLQGGEAAVAAERRATRAGGGADPARQRRGDRRRGGVHAGRRASSPAGCSTPPSRPRQFAR